MAPDQLLMQRLPLQISEDPIMATLTFGNLSVDMRREDEYFGMTPVQAGMDFLEHFEPLDVSVLVETPTYVEARVWDASNQYATLYLWVTGETPSSVSLSKVGIKEDATGFYSEIGGSITFDINGNFFGTATSLTLLDKASGALYLKAKGFSLAVNDDTPQLDSLGEMPIYLSGNDSIISGSGNDYLLGFAGNDVLRGNGGNDTLKGGSGDDVLWGAAGNDKLYGDAGADTMLGGSGSDTYYVGSTGDKVYETTSTTSTTNSGGTDKVVSTVSFSLAAYQGVAFVEHLTLSGSSAISGAGNGLANRITGNGAANSLKGGSGNDVLAGAAGNDKLYGDAGADTMLGGSGNDTYYVGSTGDKVYETTSTTSTTNAGGTDKVVSTVSFSLAAYKGVAFVEHLTLSGSSAISGIGNSLANRITGNGAANSLKGGSGNDVLSGGAGNDTLYGEKGNDTLYGNSGNDLLRGGTGNDVLYGGTGKDLFRLDAALSASTNVDRIRDFSVADDTIQLENAIFTRFGTHTGPIASGNFKASTSGRATDSNDYILYETDTGKILYDADGNGAGGAVEIAVVGTQLAMTSADFVLV